MARVRRCHQLESRGFLRFQKWQLTSTERVTVWHIQRNATFSSAETRLWHFIERQLEYVWLYCVARVHSHHDSCTILENVWRKHTPHWHTYGRLWRFLSRISFFFFESHVSTYKYIRTSHTHDHYFFDLVVLLCHCNYRLQWMCQCPVSSIQCSKWTETTCLSLIPLHYHAIVWKKKLNLHLMGLMISPIAQ